MGKTGKALAGSGKTFFNRNKPTGVSWIKLRDEAIRNGTWSKVREQTERRPRRDSDEG